FASRRTLPASLADALGMGVGFTLGLALISAVRELLGSGQLLGYTLLPGFQPALMMALPPGALLVIGGMLGFFNLLKGRKE
ncbi:MAG: Rnf-Nqr domain containing protein, partial [Candidatus Omnitrophica bacterium]|nr:Rnf-Nqr domain containing protein [Candidatus Omnitrophota bacterium]